jgi:hypothetical protein
MAGFDPKTVDAWVRGQSAAARRATKVYPPREALRLALSLIEAGWSVAQSPLNRRLHEQNAQRAREVWLRLARATGKLPAVRGSGRRSRR